MAKLGTVSASCKLNNSLCSDADDVIIIDTTPTKLGKLASSSDAKAQAPVHSTPFQTVTSPLVERPSNHSILDDSDVDIVPGTYRYDVPV